MKKISKHISGLFLFTFLIFSFALFPKALSLSGTVKTQSTNLNVREKASLSSNVIGSVKNKKELSLLSEKGDFYKVEYKKGKYGYVSKSFVAENTSAYKSRVSTSGQNLNVRSSPSLSGKVTAKLKNGSNVIVTKKGTDFHRILFGSNSVGYVSADYLKKISANESYKKIDMKVVSFKQTDSRWKNVPIGTTGGTIGTIGCTTTALAMSESFRQGKTITPPQMKNSLSYSPSGSLYWPQSYSTELAESDFLWRIYYLLSNNKPVIFGAKNSSGSKQHWVVVTSHLKNTTALKAENFKINDPGSNSRTTLADFLKEYPVAYKLAYFK